MVATMVATLVTLISPITILTMILSIPNALIMASVRPNNAATQTNH